jgi:predicted GTPase
MATYKKWTQAEKDFILNNAILMDDKSLAEKLSSITNENITISMVRRQRRKFGVAKTRGRKKKNVNEYENLNRQ